MPRQYYDDDYGSSRGRSSSRSYYDDAEERRNEGRSRGGEFSSHRQDRDEFGRFTGYDQDERGSRSLSRYGSSRGERDDRDDRDDRDYDYRDSRSSRGSNGGDMTDSAGRHYSRDSWERAQEGRSRGGMHSHGGGRRSESDYESRGRSRSSRYSDDY